MEHSKEEWQDVDDFDDPKEFANYLDANTAQNAVKRYKKKDLPIAQYCQWKFRT